MKKLIIFILLIAGFSYFYFSKTPSKEFKEVEKEEHDPDEQIFMEYVQKFNKFYPTHDELIHWLKIFKVNRDWLNNLNCNQLTF